MFAAICSPVYFKEIEQAVASIEGQIIHRAIGIDIDITSEIEKIGRISIKHLIIDITSITEHKKFVQCLMKYRILNDKTQIIVIAPNCVPGNELIHMLVSQVHVCDIIAPMGETDKDITFLSDLLSCISEPAPFKKCVKWLIDDGGSFEEAAASKEKERIKIVDREVERTVTITKEKIVGTVVIAVAGTMSRIGTTHTAISLAVFLKNNNFKVALVELHNCKVFNSIKSSYEDTVDNNEFFFLDGIDHYPYSPSLSLLDVLQKNYNYIVIDMGVYLNCDLTEFKRANVRVIISGVKDWELDGLESILRKDNTIQKNFYYFTFANKEQFEMVLSNMDKLSCIHAPYEPDPYKVTKDISPTFSFLLKDVLPETNATKPNKLKNILSLKVKGCKP